MNKFLSIFLLSLSFSAIFSNSGSESDSSGDSSPGFSDDDTFALAFSKNSKNKNLNPDKNKDKVKPAKKSPRMSSKLPLGKRVLDWQNGGTIHLEKDEKYKGFSKDAKNKAKFLHSFAEAVDQYYSLAIPKKDEKQCAISAFLWMNTDLDGREKMPCQVEYGQTSQGTIFHRFLKTTYLDSDVENKANRFFVNKTKDPKPLRDKNNLPLKFSDGSFVVDDNNDYVEICHPTQNGGYHLFLYK